VAISSYHHVIEKHPLNEEQFEIDEVPSTTMEYLDITTEDWKLWDPTGIDDDFTVFSCERALYKLRRRQEHVRRVRATCALVRKVPELDEMLGVLSGELISTVEFGPNNSVQNSCTKPRTCEPRNAVIVHWPS
jgi:hypothetical protein